MPKTASCLALYRLALALVACAFVSISATAAVGTEFTYQGKIAQSGTAITGPVDFEFELFDSALGSGSVGGPITRSDVAAANGLFTTQLDFGTGAFDGAPRWLEIRVSPDYPTIPYTTLTPRQELTPTPYAMFADGAATAVNADNASNADTLDSLDSAAFALSAHTHAASTVSGVTSGHVVYGSGSGLAGEASLTWDEAGNNLTVGNDIDAGGLYKIDAAPVVRVNPATDSTFIGLSGNGTATGTGNTAVGDGALTAADTVYSNTAVGAAALAQAKAGAQGHFGAANTAVGASSLAANTIGFANVGVGALALGANVDGYLNVAVGAQAAGSVQSGEGNVAIGGLSMISNVNADGNTAVGLFTLMSATAGQNTAIGANAMQSNTTGTGNTAVGAYALDSINDGNHNTAIGNNAMSASTLGSGENTAVGAGALQNISAFRNTAVGFDAGRNVTGGNDNIFIGYTAGSSLTGGESNNIFIGATGTAGDTNMIRIGTLGVQNHTRIHGINGTLIAGPTATVVINANGQLGTGVLSSGQYKEGVRDMGAAADQLLRLRPVVFRYREAIAPGDEARSEQYGLIAEEVAAVNPDWAIRDSNGAIISVRYDQVNAALLGLVQRQNDRIDELTDQLRQVAARLSELEAAGVR